MKVSRMLIVFAVALAMFSVLGVATPKAARAQATAPACPPASVNDGNVQYQDQGGAQDEQTSSGLSSATAEATPEQASGDTGDAVPTGTPTITEAEAKQAAAGCVPGATVTKITLDDENGVLVYSVELGSTDVKVDAKTGTVIGIDQGTANEAGGEQPKAGEAGTENNG